MGLCKSLIFLSCKYSIPLSANHFGIPFIFLSCEPYVLNFFTEEKKGCVSRIQYPVSPIPYLVSRIPCTSLFFVTTRIFFWLRVVKEGTLTPFFSRDRYPFKKRVIPLFFPKMRVSFRRDTYPFFCAAKGIQEIQGIQGIQEIQEI